MADLARHTTPSARAAMVRGESHSSTLQRAGESSAPRIGLWELGLLALLIAAKALLDRGRSRESGWARLLPQRRKVAIGIFLRGLAQVMIRKGIEYSLRRIAEGAISRESRVPA